MIADEYGLLKTFRSLFDGTQYLHRDSSLGDWVASYLYEDLYKLRKSSKLNKRIAAGLRVLNTQNRTVGIARRREMALSASWFRPGLRLERKDSLSLGDP